MDGKRKNHKCNLCSFKSASAKDLKIHYRKHTGEKPYECSVCKKAFSQIYNCQRHEAIHTGEKPYECDVCQARFTEKGSLRKHMRFHIGDEEFKCTICNKVFSQSSHLKDHIQIHSEDEPFKCLHCEKSFKLKASLRYHILCRHTTERKTYECSTCGQVFLLKVYLTRHTRYNHGEKPYECLICNKKFSRKYTLSVHSKIHTRKKKQKCSDFSESFVKKMELTEHENQPSRKIFQCKCQKFFSSNSALKKHMKRKHSIHQAFEPETNSSFVEQSASSSCETLCSTRVSVKECGTIGHKLPDPLELSSYVKDDVKSVYKSGDDIADFVQTCPEKITLIPKLCQKQEICSGDEISDEFEDSITKEENTFALKEETYDQDMEKAVLGAEYNKSSSVLKENEFHTVYIKEEPDDSSL